MKKSRLMGAVIITLGMLISSAHAALVTQIVGLDIGGMLYDVTFHTDTSFDTLWDADIDKILGDNDGAIFNVAPTFWGDQAGAELAAGAIMAYLGSVDTTTSLGDDSFRVPYGFTSSGDVLSVSDDISPTTDSLSLLGHTSDKTTPRRPLVSFTISTVPVPAAAWLFGSGLIGLIGVARRKHIRLHADQ